VSQLRSHPDILPVDIGEEIMMQKNIVSFRFAQILIVAVLFGTFGTAMAANDDEWPPAVTSDGLNLVEGTKASAVWVKDGANFSGYKRVMIIDVGVVFKKNWRRDYNRDQISLGLKVSESDAEKIKQRVSDEFKKTLTEELEKADYEVADYDFNLAEADILVLRPAIIDLVVTAPDDGSGGMGRTFAGAGGGMTLYLEFYDSVSSSLLGRIVDRKNSTRSTNRAEADRMFSRWTALLITKMDAVMKKDQ
jgi:hypothetical protein